MYINTSPCPIKGHLFTLCTKYYQECYIQRGLKPCQRFFPLGLARLPPLDFSWLPGFFDDSNGCTSEKKTSIENYANENKNIPKNVQTRVMTRENDINIMKSCKIMCLKKKKAQDVIIFAWVDTPSKNCTNWLFHLK